MEVVGRIETVGNCESDEQEKGMVGRVENGGEQ